MIFRYIYIPVLAAMLLSPTAYGHEGRRLDIQVIGDQLFAQGYIGGGGADDGGGNPRPYYNVIHSHWSNAGGAAAFATLPGFSILDPGALLGFDVTIELIGAKRWDNPTHGHGVIPDLTDLTGETIEVSYQADSVYTNNLGGQLLLIDNLGGVEDDIDLSYIVDLSPSNRLYALEWQLSTDKPGIAPSDSVWTLLAPDPAVGGLHHTALHLENFLGVNAVPEPGSAAILACATAAFVSTRRRRRMR